MSDDKRNHLAIDVDVGRAALGVTDGFSVEIAIAVGRKGDGAHLSPALLQREQPSDRAPVRDVVARGLFTDRFGGA